MVCGPFFVLYWIFFIVYCLPSIVILLPSFLPIRDLGLTVSGLPKIVVSPLIILMTDPYAFPVIVLYTLKVLPSFMQGIWMTSAINFSHSCPACSGFKKSKTVMAPD